MDIHSLLVRLDRLEEKLDAYHREVTVNTVDINWIKGSVRAIIPAVIALVGFMAYEVYSSIKMPIVLPQKQENYNDVQKKQTR